ncbi:hypothetical protein DPMN_146938 [Dreissena polymorpha]|uniref:Uncharacterized protein n=1 Tax=Dreissena polymorpha TaxID=45954 RepID=A0A9D4J2I0_DREPO|nr:hypothetical protein DPMN_146938 [Dreissena polymorpha]
MTKCYAGGTNYALSQTDISLKMLRWRYKLPKVHNHTDRYFFENVTPAVQTP